MFYIYSIVNKVTGGIYIGKTKNVKRRWGQHVKISSQEDPRTKLHRAMKKYGVENFEMQVIDENDDEKYVLNVLERTWIQKMRDEGRDVYNLTDGGEGNVGYVPTQETREKLSQALKGNTGRLGVPHSDETKKKISEIHKGRKFTDEHRKKLSNARRQRPVKEKESIKTERRPRKKVEKRKPVSDATKQKLRELNTGKVPTEEARRKISQKLSGRPKPPRSEEHCRKLSEAARARGTMSEEQKRKISESMKKSKNVGHPIDEETKKKIGSAQRGRVHTEEEKARRAASLRAYNERRRATEAALVTIEDPHSSDVATNLNPVETA